MQKRKTKKSGFTLIELMVTILIASIVLLGLANVIADAHRGYGKMYTRVHGNIVNDAYVARLRFDKICRQARAGSAALNADATAVQVLYYSTPNVNGSADGDDELNRYALFYQSGTDLMLETGTYDPNTGNTTPTGTPETVAGNVMELQFSAPDTRSVQMVMTLKNQNPANDDDRHSITVTCGAIMHN